MPSYLYVHNNQSQQILLSLPLLKSTQWHKQYQLLISTHEFLCFRRRFAFLRQRVEDIPLLLQHFISMFNDRRKAELIGVSDQAMALLCEYPWPGNVREIGNIVERIAILKRRGLIEPEDLPEKIRRLPPDHLPSMPAAIPVGGLDLSRAVEEFENRLILEALERTNWVKSKAARLLQINRTTLIEKLKKKSLAEVVAQRATPPEDLVDA